LLIINFYNIIKYEEKMVKEKIVEEGLATAGDIDNKITTGFNDQVELLGMGRGARGGWK
jgi:hypothetical protein